MHRVNVQSSPEQLTKLPHDHRNFMGVSAVLPHIAEEPREVIQIIAIDETLRTSTCHDLTCFSRVHIIYN